MSETGEPYGDAARKPGGELRALSWARAADWLPDTRRVVLATDGEGHYLACWDDERQRWYNAADDLEMDSVVLGWMELPEIPDY